MDCEFSNLNGRCHRKGKLVEQIVEKWRGELFVHREYLCLYHKGSENKKLPIWVEKLEYLEFIPDEELIALNNF
jgi:hypothetical protein